MNERQKDMCDQKITEREVFEALKNVKKNKSPGIDGLIPEFYKEYWETLKQPFMDMLEETYTEGEMPDTMKQSLLTLIFKKGDKHLLKNYRPISLSNYDYKIVAFVLASRLQKVMQCIISTDQSGYIKGRFIGQNARLIQDILEYTDKFKLPGVLLCLDFKKAFDRLEWNFMTEVLKKFNFGDNFIKWVKIFYFKANIIIKNNGWLAEPLQVQRGIRQGCPISALLFVISVEILSIIIRRNKNVKGFCLKNKTYTISQYADDSTLMLSDLESIMYALNDIENFCRTSGMKLNIDKTEGIWLGAFKENPEYYQGIKFTNGPVRCLGIYIGHDKEGCFNENWLKKINRLENSLHVWKSRKLTLFGKNLILKSLAISKLVYNFTVLEVLPDIIKVINKIFFNFLWHKTERIKRNVLINDFQNGGIRMIDVESTVRALKAAWIPRLLSDNGNCGILDQYLTNSKVSVKVLIEGGVTDQKVFPKEICLPQFYIDCITSFNLCKDKPNTNVHSFLVQPIWCNDMFKWKGKCIIFKHWIDSGFLWVKDLYDESGNFLTDKEIYMRLTDKRNWMSEYLLLKNTVGKSGMLYKNRSYAKYENIKPDVRLVANNKVYIVKDQKAKFFYPFIIRKKTTRSYIERFWAKEFSVSLTRDNWKNIYVNRILNLPNKKLSEFAYKLIHRLVPSRSTLFKWKRSDTDQCPQCKNVETVKHLYFECESVKIIWTKLEMILRTKITWKKLILGQSEDVTIHRVHNLLFTVVLYSIFKFGVKSMDNPVNNEKIACNIIKDVFIWNRIVEQCKIDKDYILFKKILKNLSQSVCESLRLK